MQHRRRDDQFRRLASGTAIERDIWESRLFVDQVTDWGVRALDGLL
jgi:hypothetical protein